MKLHILFVYLCICNDPGYRLEGTVLLVLYPAGIREFSLFKNVQTGFGAHRASCSMYTGGWSWKLNFVYHHSLNLLDLSFRVVHMHPCGAEGQLYLICLTTL